MSDWASVLELSSDRSIIAGSQTVLSDAIRRGADLRIYTEFRHNEHVDVKSDNPEVVQEVAEFPVTYLLDDRWTAGIMTLRQPVTLPDSFGRRSSMSFFLYNQDGRQAIARPYFDGPSAKDISEESRLDGRNNMPKYHKLDSCDDGTNAPSSNFIYDFELFRYWVRDDWKEVLSHKADGTISLGTIDTLTKAFGQGCEIKVGIRGLCNDLAENPIQAIDHEVFVYTGSCYYYTEDDLFIAGTHPIVRVRPEIPLSYLSKGWDFGWLIVRTDGFVALRLYDPYTLKFFDSNRHCALRWFVR